MNYRIIGIGMVICIYILTSNELAWSSSKCMYAKMQISIFEEELEQFHADLNRYPTNEEGLDALKTNISKDSSWKGPYINKGIPLNPWGHKYKYIFPNTYGDHKYDIYSFGKNGLDDHGGGDDISNWKGVNATYYDSSISIKWISIFGILIVIIATTVYVRHKNKGGVRP